MFGFDALDTVCFDMKLAAVKTSSVWLNRWS